MKNQNTKNGLPTRQQIIDFISNSTTPAGKREIAKAFGLHAQDKIALKAMLKDMTRITGDELPEKVKAAVNSAEFRGAKTYYKHKKKEEYAVEVRDGEISSFHFFDRNGQPRNKQP